jgi:putative spermidine/putrescine transport system substrate-binding protein/spermidine/putrescine transport system substrate-binding protein
MKKTEEIRVLVPKGISRRRLLQLLGVAGLGMASSGLLPASARGAETKPAAAPTKVKSLNMFTYLAWSNADILAYYKNNYGIEVKPTVYAGDSEMMAKLVGGGTKLYDMCVPVQFAVKVAANAGVIEPMNKNSLTYYKDVYPEAVDAQHWEVDGKFYGVPFVWGANAMAWDRKAAGRELDSLDALFDPKWKGKIGMPDDSSEALAIGALKLGIKKPYQMNEQQLQEVKKLLLSQKPLVRTYWKNYSEAANLMSSGEVVVCWARLSIVNLARQAGSDIGWVWPKEGALGWTEAISAVKGTTKKAAVEAFANWTISPEYGKMLGEKTSYTTSSKAAVAQMDPALIAKMGFDIGKLSRLVMTDLPANKPRYDEIWNEIKNA